MADNRPSGRKLKVYRTWVFAKSHVQAAARAERPQMNAIVAATSQAKAAESIGCTLGHLRRFGGETANVVDVSVALAEPGVTFYSAMDHTSKSRYVREDGSVLEPSKVSP